MIAFLGRLTTFDWVKIVAYAISALTLLDGTDALTAWGMSPADATMWSHRFATILGALTLISNALKNPSPQRGTSPVLAASPTPVVLPTSPDSLKVVPL